VSFFKTLSIAGQISIENDRRFAFVQDQFVEPAVHAVYSYANALKRAHADKCGGMTGMCALLKSMTTEDFYLNYLSKTDFKYSKKERVESLASAQLDPYHAPAKVKFDTNGDITDYSFEIYSVRFVLTTLVVIGTDCIGSSKSNYHMITTKMAP
jgi:hypothetical protein